MSDLKNNLYPDDLIPEEDDQNPGLSGEYRKYQPDEPEPTTKSERFYQEPTTDNKANLTSNSISFFPRPNITQTETNNLDPSRRCVIMGPSQTGKTSILLAIGQACYQPVSDSDIKLKFIPKGNTAILMKNAIRAIAKEGPDQGLTKRTREVSDYPFQINVSAKAQSLLGPPIKTFLHMNIKDGPGGALFDGELKEEMSAPINNFHEELIKEVKDSRSLILCINAVEPTVDVLMANLPQLIDKMRSPVPIANKVSARFKPIESLKQFIKQLKPKDPLTQPNEFEQVEDVLNIDRFLILLNKIDVILSKEHRPLDIAKRVSPIKQAVEILGVSFLNEIQQALKPDAKFAIGISSAWGFHPTNGKPLVDGRGRIGKMSVETGDEMLKLWRPFGIREAIFFITTGIALEPTVQIVTEEDITL
ncbi:MAG: hypothetical protein HY819_17080 [Acidobacteria bacterium]|nr:hypothetical protein [Acidobacteriota bacterium]